jgi:hypothetical protein
MKKLVVLVVAAVSLWAASALPSHAAGPYSIAGPAASPSADGASRFVDAGCDTRLVDSKADGIDSKIIDISSRINTTLQVTWTAEPHVAGAGSGNLTAKFFSAACSGVPVPLPTSRTPGRWSVPVPGAAKWMVVVSTNEAQVQFSFP